MNRPSAGEYPNLDLRTAVLLDDAAEHLVDRQHSGELVVAVSLDDRDPTIGIEQQLVQRYGCEAPGGQSPISFRVGEVYAALRAAYDRSYGKPPQLLLASVALEAEVLVPAKGKGKNHVPEHLAVPPTDITYTLPVNAAGHRKFAARSRVRYDGETKRPNRHTEPRLMLTRETRKSPKIEANPFYVRGQDNTSLGDGGLSHAAFRGRLGTRQL